MDGWLNALGLEALERAERDGVVSWDLLLDGLRRQRVRVTLILDPSLALVAWVHYAPPLSDSFRKSYRQFLRWNDELPFVKFALSEDERPVLTAEIPAAQLSLDALGLTLARLLAVCDLLLDESRRWLWPGGRAPAEARNAGQPPQRHAPSAVLARYAEQLKELTSDGAED